MYISIHAEKIALSGLSYDHLRLAIERGGHEGLQAVLGEKTESSNLRVTKNKSIVEKKNHFLLLFLAYIILLHRNFKSSLYNNTFNHYTIADFNIYTGIGEEICTVSM